MKWSWADIVVVGDQFSSPQNGHQLGASHVVTVTVLCLGMEVKSELVIFSDSLLNGLQ